MTDSELTISGGYYAGQTLRTPEEEEIRPMRTRIREAVFDQMSVDLNNWTFLDCFAGTGAMGLEALSRGADRAVFLDRSPSSLSCIRENVDAINPAGEVRVTRCDLLEDRPALDGEQAFQIISVTPPYRVYREPDSRRKLIDFLAFISQKQHMTDNARVIVECERGTRFGRAPGTLDRTDQRTFGKTEIHWFQSDPSKAS